MADKDSKGSSSPATIDEIAGTLSCAQALFPLAEIWPGADAQAAARWLAAVVREASDELAKRSANTEVYAAFGRARSTARTGLASAVVSFNGNAISS